MNKSMRAWTICTLFFICSGCTFVTPTSDQIQSSLTALPATSFPPTVHTPIPSSTPGGTSTITPTKLATLENERAHEAIEKLLQEPVDCPAPCFWGITPGITTSNNAQEIFGHLGISTTIIRYADMDYYNVDYDFDDGISLGVILPIQNDLVKSINIKFQLFPQEAGVPRRWRAYSPETLIQRYGKPSRVDFSADWGAAPLFVMQMYFDKEDLIVAYSGQKVIPATRGTSQVCPLTAEFDSVWIWMGKNPLYPPAEGFSLEEATSLTLDEFSKLMTGSPQFACFPFYGERINLQRTGK